MHVLLGPQLCRRFCKAETALSDCCMQCITVFYAPLMHHVMQVQDLGLCMPQLLLLQGESLPQRLYIAHNALAER